MGNKMLNSLNKLLSNLSTKLSTFSSKNNQVFLLILVLVLTEIVFNINPIFGFILYGLLVTFFLIFLSKEENLDGYVGGYDKLMIVLMIIPLVRITSMFISLDFFWKVFISYGILLFLAFYYSFRFKIHHGYTKENLNLFPLIIIIGIIIGLIGNFIFDFQSFNNLILLVPLIAFSEEVFFRGMIQNIMKENYKVSLSILISSLLYGVFSLSYGYLFASFMYISGIIIGTVYYKTKNIYLTTAINFFMHVFLFIIPIY